MKLDDEDLALDKGRRTLMRNNAVGPDFFHTLGVPVLLGREFSDTDQAGSTPVAVVNELFAQKLLPGQSRWAIASTARPLWAWSGTTSIAAWWRSPSPWPGGTTRSSRRKRG